MPVDPQSWNNKHINAEPRVLKNLKVDGLYKYVQESTMKSEDQEDIQLQSQVYGGWMRRKAFRIFFLLPHGFEILDAL